MSVPYIGATGGVSPRFSFRGGSYICRLVVAINGGFDSIEP